MSRGCSGGASAATTTTTMSMLAAMARRRCATCGSARASRLRRGSTAITRWLSSRRSTSTSSPTARSLCWWPARSAGSVAATSSSPSRTVQAPATMPVTMPRSPPAAAAADSSASSCPAPSSGATQLEQELVELGRAGAGLLRPHRRPAQLGRSSSESEPLAVVELGEHGLESSALLLVHLWMSPSGEVRHDRARRGRDARSRTSRRCAQQRRRASGASPTVGEERRRPPRGRPGDRSVQTVLEATSGPSRGVTRRCR